MECKNSIADGKVDQLIREFDKYMLHILGISEMKWKGSDKITKEGKTILYSGNEEIHRNSVGMILNNEASRSLMGWKPVNERILTARFKTVTTKQQLYRFMLQRKKQKKKRTIFITHCKTL